MAWPEDKGKYTWDAYPRIDTAECCEDFDLIGSLWTNLNNINQDVQAGNLYAIIQEDDESGSCWVGIWKPRERHGSPNCNCESLRYALSLAEEEIEYLKAGAEAWRKANFSKRDAFEDEVENTENLRDMIDDLEAGNVYGIRDANIDDLKDRIDDLEAENKILREGVKLLSIWEDECERNETLERQLRLAAVEYANLLADIEDVVTGAIDRLDHFGTIAEGDDD
jgi:hypothetical protein